MMGYLQIGLAIALAALLGLFLNAERRLSNAHEEIGKLKALVAAVSDANNSTVASLKACLSINAENQTYLETAVQRAAEAAERADSLATTLEAMNVPITSTNTDCRTLADPLPADFVRQLCIPDAANCSQD